jgi:hypothetical protein
MWKTVKSVCVESCMQDSFTVIGEVTNCEVTNPNRYCLISDESVTEGIPEYQEAFLVISQHIKRDRELSKVLTNWQ